MKRVKWFIIIVITSFFYMFIEKRVKSELLKRDIENSIMNFLNEGKHCKYFGEYQLDWLEQVKKGNVNNYDITEFVNYFIETSIRSIETKLGMNHQKEFIKYEKSVQSHYKDISVVSLCYWFYKYFDKYITEEDVELYKNKKIKQRIINELKNKLDYSDGKWYVRGNENKKIDLLYGFYLNYIPDNRLEKIKPKSILNIKVLNKYLSRISYDKNRSIDVLIKYIDYEDNIIEAKERISIHIRDIEHLNVESLSTLYYEYPNKWILSQLQVSHYSKDAEDEEYREWERLRIEDDLDPSTILADTNFKRIEIFKKYNKYNNCEQYASIMVDTYEDGSSKSYFRKFIVITDEDGKHIREEYMQRELPYKNKSIDEVMELYINDKEQYSIDEELLKNGNELVEYKKFTLP